MPEDVWVVGVAMTPFGRAPDQDVVDLGTAAALASLADAGVGMPAMDLLAVGNRLDLAGPGGGLGHRLAREIGQTGLPIYHCMAACASGAAALRTAVMAIKAGEADFGIAIGVEKMAGLGLLVGTRPDGEGPFSPSGRDGAICETEGLLGSSSLPAVFAEAGLDYERTHPGVTVSQFARVAEKNHWHSTLNPLAQYQKAYGLEEILEAPMVSYPNTTLMCCPNADGAAAVVVVSGAALRRLDPIQQRRAVKITASVAASDPWSGSGVVPDFNTPTRSAADQAYESAGVGPEDLDLVELHDCFATAEFLHYENLRLCEDGGAADFIDSGAPWRDGRTPVNVSGGLLSKGHPVGATGIANVYEVVTHLRGEAGARQIEDARVGLTHVVGLGTTCIVHILERSSRS